MRIRYWVVFHLGSINNCLNYCQLIKFQFISFRDIYLFILTVYSTYRSKVKITVFVLFINIFFQERAFILISNYYNTEIKLIKYKNYNHVLYITV